MDKNNWTWSLPFCIFLLLIQVKISTCSVPEFESKSKDMIKIVGSDIFMSCNFKGVITYTWLKDGKVIIYSNRIYYNKISNEMQVLNIKKFQAADKGLYSCVAFNQHGKSSANISVDAILPYKPKIHPISDVYLKAGDSFKVTCDADAIPTAVTYNWRKRSGHLSGNTVFVRDKNVLHIKNILKSDEGIYECTARNSLGTTLESFNLRIATNTIWVDKPKDEDVSTTKPFVWVASIVTLSKNPIFKWYKDGSHILRDSTTSQQGAKFISRLNFPDLNLGDAGVYMVTVEKIDVAGLQSDMKLTIFSPPLIQITEGKEIRVDLGDELLLTCNVAANPKPSIKWYFKDKVLKSLSANGNQVLTLKKDDLTKDDMGMYICYSENGKGNSTVSINVIVESAGVSVAVKVTIIIIVCGVIAGLVVLAVLFYLRYGERCIKAGIDEGTFYTDLVQEEKEVKSLADLEKNPNTLKRNINMSTRKNTSATAFNNGGAGGGRLSIKTRGKKPSTDSVDGQTSIFDTIKGNQRYSRQGSVFQTIKTTLTRPSLTGAENHEVRLGSFALCSGHSIDINELSFDEIIAEGEYGGVSRGQMADEDDINYKQVAIKMLKDELMKTCEKRNMLAEIRVMRRIPAHENLVEFVGWTVTPSNVYIVEEYIPFGNLLTFLRAQRDLRHAVDANEDEICVDQYMLCSYAQQIAAGMMHLGKFHIIHRDLACRNIYIGYENTIKISDYAIVRDIYTPNVYRNNTGGQIPVRWMAYEAIFSGEYSIKSDVWSFGILLWEMCSLGRIPYPNIMRTEQLLEELFAGYHMENPGNVSTDLFLLMDSCWNKNPASRPTFNSLYAAFTEYMSDINDTKENIVHIDLSNCFSSGNKMSVSSDQYMLTPNDDHHRPHPFDTVAEEDEDGGLGEDEPLTLNC